MRPDGTRAWSPHSHQCHSHPWAGLPGALPPPAPSDSHRLIHTQEGERAPPSPRDLAPRARVTLHTPRASRLPGDVDCMRRMCMACAWHAHGMCMACAWLSQVTSIACGARHTLALTSTREIFTWGSGCSGQLGHGSRHDEMLPRPVQTFQSRGLKAQAIAAGAFHSCAVIGVSKAKSSQLFSWGEGRMRPDGTRAWSPHSHQYHSHPCHSHPYHSHPYHSHQPRGATSGAWQVTTGGWATATSARRRRRRRCTSTAPRLGGSSTPTWTSAARAASSSRAASSPPTGAATFSARRRAMRWTMLTWHAGGSTRQP